MSNIKLFNYLKINNIEIDNSLLLIKTDLLKQIIKKYKLKCQLLYNKKYKLSHPEKARELARVQSHKTYHNNIEYRMNKINSEKKKYHNKKQSTV